MSIKTLAELNLRNVERATYDKQLAFTTYPELFDPIFLEPIVIRILMVADGRCNFSGDRFGLTMLLEALNLSPGPYVSFAVVKAHREVDQKADHQSFKFTEMINDFDSVWLFADQDSQDKDISNEEKNVIRNFMDNGGGVLAAGDHDSVGRSMCDKLHRVQHMRNWKTNSATDFKSEFRKDTLVAAKGVTGPLCFIDLETDDIPQQIIPTTYKSALIANAAPYPHALLCGPHGIISVLPDHIHEGECNENPDTTDASEFPRLFGSVVVRPQIVARGQVTEGHESDPTDPCSKTNLLPKTVGGVFALIGAYDGHKVKVGRVVVDSSFHHFLNRNLTGLIGSQYSNDIKRYFHNIGVWSAPANKQLLMLGRALWVIRWMPPLVNELSAIKNEGDISGIDWNRRMEIGALARTALNEVASQCLTTQWMLQLINTLVPEKLRTMLYDPWHASMSASESQLSFNTETLINASLAGSVLQIAASFSKEGSLDELKAKVRNNLSEVVSSGASKGIQSFREYLNRFSKAFD